MPKITTRHLTEADHVWLNEPTTSTVGSVHKLMLARGITPPKMVGPSERRRRAAEKRGDGGRDEPTKE